jgi:hypothetical protein
MPGTPAWGARGSLAAVLAAEALAAAAVAAGVGIGPPGGLQGVGPARSRAPYLAGAAPTAGIGDRGCTSSLAAGALELHLEAPLEKESDLAREGSRQGSHSLAPVHEGGDLRRIAACVPLETDAEYEPHKLVNGDQDPAHILEPFASSARQEIVLHVDQHRAALRDFFSRRVCIGPQVLPVSPSRCFRVLPPCSLRCCTWRPMRTHRRVFLRASLSPITTLRSRSEISTSTLRFVLCSRCACRQERSPPLLCRKTLRSGD